MRAMVQGAMASLTVTVVLTVVGIANSASGSRRRVLHEGGYYISAIDYLNSRDPFLQRLIRGIRGNRLSLYGASLGHIRVPRPDTGSWD